LYSNNLKNVLKLQRKEILSNNSEPLTVAQPQKVDKKHALVYFGVTKKFSLNAQMGILQNAIEHLDRHIENNTKLTSKDKAWVKKLEKVFNSELSIDEINSSHEHKWLEQYFDHRKLLRDTLNAVLEATKYQLVKKQFRNYVLPVHNPQIAKKLKYSYNQQNFSELFALCKEKGVFGFKFDEQGFAVTASIDMDEEKAMAGNIWVTDTARCLDAIRSCNPKKDKIIIEKLSDFYMNEKSEFEEVIKNPAYYSSSNEIKGVNHWNGVHHAFNSKTLQGNPKFLTIRLDSLGIYMQKASESIINNTYKPQYIPDNLVDTLAYIPMYLKSIKYPDCKTCGNWENNVFEHGITSDTEIVRIGLKVLHEILTSDNLDCQNIARKIADSHQKISQKLGLSSKKLSDEVDLLIKKGQARLDKDYLNESVSDTAWQNRPIDASLSFVTHTSKLDEDVLLDVGKNIEILKRLEKLLGENGLMRYERDAYENLNFDTVLNSREVFDFASIKEGSFDAKPPALKHRAQWFLVSDISKGYGVQLAKLADKIKEEGLIPTEEELKLMNKCFDMQTQYLNRAFARITPEGALKSNGRPCPGWKVPESYMAVTSLKKDKKGNFEPTYLPGINTPLAWAQSSLYDASMQYISSIKKMEELKLIKFLTQLLCF
jgi:hypothetical protein